MPFLLIHRLILFLGLTLLLGEGIALAQPGRPPFGPFRKKRFGPYAEIYTPLRRLREARRADSGSPPLPNPFGFGASSQGDGYIETFRGYSTSQDWTWHYLDRRSVHQVWTRADLEKWLSQRPDRQKPDPRERMRVDPRSHARAIGHDSVIAEANIGAFRERPKTKAASIDWFGGPSGRAPVWLSGLPGWRWEGWAPGGARYGARRGAETWTWNQVRLTGTASEKPILASDWSEENEVGPETWGSEHPHWTDLYRQAMAGTIRKGGGYSPDVFLSDAGSWAEAWWSLAFDDLSDDFPWEDWYGVEMPSGSGARRDSAAAYISPRGAVAIARVPVMHMVEEPWLSDALFAHGLHFEIARFRHDPFLGMAVVPVGSIGGYMGQWIGVAAADFTAVYAAGHGRGGPGFGFALGAYSSTQWIDWFMSGYLDEFGPEWPAYQITADAIWHQWFMDGYFQRVQGERAAVTVAQWSEWFMQNVFEGSYARRPRHEVPMEEEWDRWFSAGAGAIGRMPTYQDMADYQWLEWLSEGYEERLFRRATSYQRVADAAWLEWFSEGYRNQRARPRPGFEEGMERSRRGPVAQQRGAGNQGRWTEDDEEWLLDDDWLQGEEANRRSRRFVRGTPYGYASGARLAPGGGNYGGSSARGGGQGGEQDGRPAETMREGGGRQSRFARDYAGTEREGEFSSGRMGGRHRKLADAEDYYEYYPDDYWTDITEGDNWPRDIGKARPQAGRRAMKSSIYGSELGVSERYDWKDAGSRGESYPSAMDGATRQETAGSTLPRGYRDYFQQHSHYYQRLRPAGGR